MRDVRPLKSDGRITHDVSLPSRKQPDHAKQKRRENAQNARTASAAPWSDKNFSHNDEIDHSYRSSGLSSDALRRLRKETNKIRATLDLHGHSIDEARTAVDDFILACSKQGYKRIRIVHGQGFGSAKGTSILKHQVRHWLKQMPSVLGFVSAPPQDGGHGAVLVLLRSADKVD